MILVSTFCRNERCPFEGIDTLVSFLRNDDPPLSRNERYPFEGIDTRQAGLRRLVFDKVEMSVARERALTDCAPTG